MKKCFIYLSQVKYYLSERETLLCCSFTNTYLEISPQFLLFIVIITHHISFTNCAFILDLVIFVMEQMFYYLKKSCHNSVVSDL